MIIDGNDIHRIEMWPLDKDGWPLGGPHDLTGQVTQIEITEAPTTETPINLTWVYDTEGSDSHDR